MSEMGSCPGRPVHEQAGWNDLRRPLTLDVWRAFKNAR
jgi:hypothetical protein